jgi:thiamine pyrophosphate-dependent acetolactate synthase large subunit-like protein
MSHNLIPFPHTNGSNGSAQVRVVPYPARARVVVEHDDHTLDAWDQVVRLVPRVEELIDVILSLGILVDKRDQTPPDEWIESYWRLVNELIQIRHGIDVAALKRDYGPDALPIARYDDKLDDEIEVAQQELEWLIPVLEEMTATIDVVQRCLSENRRLDAAEAVGELIGVTDLEGSRLSFGELFRLWQSYRLDAQGNLVDDEGHIYAHISEFEDED